MPRQINVYVQKDKTFADYVFCEYKSTWPEMAFVLNGVAHSCAVEV